MFEYNYFPISLELVVWGGIKAYILNYYSIYLFIVYLWRSEDNLKQSILSFYFLDT